MAGEGCDAQLLRAFARLDAAGTGTERAAATALLDSCAAVVHGRRSQLAGTRAIRCMAVACCSHTNVIRGLAQARIVADREGELILVPGGSCAVMRGGGAEGG